MYQVRGREDKREEEEAALRIQARARGMQVRKGIALGNSCRYAGDRGSGGEGASEA